MTPRYGGQGRIIVCIRDQTCVHHSCNREHNHNDELTRVNMCKAADICRHLLDDPRAMLFSYETAMFLKDRYVKILLDWLGTKTLTSVTYIDGNCKYFLPNSVETAKSADEVRHTQADQISANSAETAKSADEVRHTQADRISANSAKNSNKEKPVNSTLLIRRLRPNFPRRARPYL